MSERIATKEKQSAVMGQPIAMRAVALCEGCPMAALCAGEATQTCPSGYASAYTQVERGRDTLPKSYLKELLDDSLPIVRATPRPIQSPQLPRRPPTKPQKAAQEITISRQPRKNKQLPKGETMADILADMMVDMLGVKSLKAARAKK